MPEGIADVEEVPGETTAPVFGFRGHDLIMEEPEEQALPEGEGGGPDPRPEAQGGGTPQPDDAGATAPSLPQPGDPDYRWAAKYETPQEMEQGYRELNGRFTQQTQHWGQVEQRNIQLEEALRQAMPFIQAGLQSQAVGPGGTPAPEEVDFDDPAQLNAYIDKQVQARMAPMLSQITANQQQAQTANAWAEYERTATASIDAWRARNPEIAGTAIEDEMSAIMQQHKLDLRDPGHIDLALEIWKNPAVGDFIAANPMRASTPEGRREAALLAQYAAPNGAGGPAQAAPQGAPARTAPVQGGGPASTGRAPQRPRPVAHVETGGTGAPIPGAPGEQRSRDEFDDVLDLLTGSKATVFGLRTPRR